jgi:hypothetical protein
MVKTPDDQQLPAGVWTDMARDIRGGITDPIVLASRHGISEDRAKRAITTFAPIPKGPAKKWGRR